MAVFNEEALKALSKALSNKGQWVLAYLSEQTTPVKKEAVKDGTNKIFQTIQETNEILLNSRKVFDDHIERLEGAALIAYNVDIGRAKMYYITEGGKEMLKYLSKVGRNND